MKKYIAIVVLSLLVVSCGSASSNGSTDVNTDTTNRTINTAPSSSDNAQVTNAKDSADKMINQAADKMKDASDKLKDSSR
jgi:uncharacterized protein YcfL